MAIYGTNNEDTIDGADGVTNKKDVIFGLDGDDTIYGLGGDDVMKGGGGADTFYGGSGFDEVNYTDSAETVIVDLSTGMASGGAEGDIFYSIENLTGSLKSDQFTGNGLANTLRGLGGVDHLRGLGGPDVLEGGEGWDLLEGGSGADQLSGGADFDFASYQASPAGVVVSLQHGAAMKGDAEGDMLSGIESLQGSQFGDHLYGDDNDNWIWASGGDDVLKGYGGDDELDGGADDDTLIGGTGRDVLEGDDGADTFVWNFTDETGVAPLTADFVIDFDFDEGDRIDLSGIDADVYADGNQAFTFIGTAAFSGTPGEINYYHAGYDTVIQIQTGISADVEAVIIIDDIVTPQASWFIF
jgi:Ca2+-binding RTX toxin-like protein